MNKLLFAFILISLIFMVAEVQSYEVADPLTPDYSKTYKAENLSDKKRAPDKSLFHSTSKDSNTPVMTETTETSTEKFTLKTKKSRRKKKKKSKDKSKPETTLVKETLQVKTKIIKLKAPDKSGFYRPSPVQTATTPEPVILKPGKSRDVANAPKETTVEVKQTPPAPVKTIAPPKSMTYQGKKDKTLPPLKWSFPYELVESPETKDYSEAYNAAELKKLKKKGRHEILFTADIFATAGMRSNRYQVYYDIQALNMKNASAGGRIGIEGVHRKGFGFRVMAGYQRMFYANKGIEQIKKNYMLFDIMFTYYFPKEVKKLDYYVLLGPTMLVSSSGFQPYVDFGGGLRYYLNDKISLKLIEPTVLTEFSGMWLKLSFGFNYHFR